MSSLFVLPTVNSYNISCAKNHWKGSGELKDTAQKLLSNNASEILLSLKKNFAPRGTHEIHIQFHEIRLHSRRGGVESNLVAAVSPHPHPCAGRGTGQPEAPWSSRGSPHIFPPPPRPPPRSPGRRGGVESRAGEPAVSVPPSLLSSHQRHLGTLPFFILCPTDDQLIIIPPSLPHSSFSPSHPASLGCHKQGEEWQIWKSSSQLDSRIKHLSAAEEQQQQSQQPAVPAAAGGACCCWYWQRKGLSQPLRTLEEARNPHSVIYLISSKNNISFPLPAAGIDRRKA